MKVTLRLALQGAVSRLRDAGIEDPAGDARRLLAHATDLPPERLTLHLDDIVEAPDLQRFEGLVGRRAAREPVSHLTGTRLFWGRGFIVTPAVLDPRPETEVLVAAALAEPFGRVLDLGTGSGCLLVTLLAERPLALGLGADLSPEALDVARANAARHGVEGRAGFVLSDWLAGVEGAFDLIVSNPPYIAAPEMPGLAPEVRDHEPHMALTDAGDGLAAYRAILAQARPHLVSRGRLLLEHGPSQAHDVAAIGRAAGWPEPAHLPDLDGRARACLFRAP